MITITKIIILYIITCLAFFVYCLAGNKRGSFFKLAIIIFLPVLGYLWIFIFWVWNKFKKDTPLSKTPVQVDVRRHKFNNQPVKNPDLPQEIDLVPLEEILLLNNNYTKRKTIMYILKENDGRYAPFLKKALQNEDQEAAHYAAAAIVELKRRMALALRGWALGYKGDAKNIDTRLAYAGFLRECIQSQLLDDTSLNKVRKTYNSVLKDILVDNTGEKFFIDKINCDLEFKDYDSAHFYCKIFMLNHTQSENPYLMYLKLYFLTRDVKGFEGALNTLIRSRVNISHSAKNMIGFWTGAQVNEI